MNLLSEASAIIAVVTTGILPVYLDRSRRLNGGEPSGALPKYVLLLTPRWLATGILLLECASFADWGHGLPAAVRYALLFAAHILVGLISFLSIAVAPADLKTVPPWITRSLVTVGFVPALGLVVFSRWYLGLREDFQEAWTGLGPFAGTLFVTFALFGGTVLLWAFVNDLRDQPRSPQPARQPDQATAVASPNSAPIA